MGKFEANLVTLSAPPCFTSTTRVKKSWSRLKKGKRRKKVTTPRASRRVERGLPYLKKLAARIFPDGWNVFSQRIDHQLTDWDRERDRREREIERERGESDRVCMWEREIELHGDCVRDHSSISALNFKSRVGHARKVKSTPQKSNDKS